MSITHSVYPYKPEFPSLLESYCEQISEANRKGKHHDYRRQLFIDFLRKAFGVDPGEVLIEEKTNVTQARGYIDALYKFIIFEFKTDLEAERKVAKLGLRNTSNPNLITQNIQFLSEMG